MLGLRCEERFFRTLTLSNYAKYILKAKYKPNQRPNAREISVFSTRLLVGDDDADESESSWAEFKRSILSFLLNNLARLFRTMAFAAAIDSTTKVKVM